MSDPVMLTIAQAAVFMDCSRRHARRTLQSWHRSNPELGILSRPTGATEGHMLVSATALRDKIRGRSVRVDELSDRVGYLESDMASIQARTGRIENNLFPQRTCR